MGFGSIQIKKSHNIWKFQENILSLQQIQTNIVLNMLGIDTPHKPIEGKFADEIRDIVRRMSTGKLNETDKKMIRRSRKVLEKYDAVWK